MFLVIGAGPAGIAAVRGYRAAGGSEEVVVLSADPDAPYARPPLSKAYLQGKAGPGDLDLLDPDESSSLGVRVVPTRATTLDPARRLVTADDGSAYPYRDCLLATGSVPARLPAPGGDDPRVLSLRSLADARRLRAAAGAASSAIVVGSGFIGCEAAASLARLGLSVRLISDETLPQERRLGPAAARRIAGWLANEGVEVAGGAAVSAISFDAPGPTRDGEPAPVRVSLDEGPDVRADLLLVAVGATPAVELARAAGIPRRDGRVLTDAGMRTRVDHVLAAGDIALAENRAAGRPLAVEHWGEATTMGEIAGSVAAGVPRSWADAPGFWSEIGDRVLKHVAWGDGYRSAELVERGGSGFSVWYRDAAGQVVGVLTHDADEDYDRCRQLLEAGSANGVRSAQ